MKRVRWIILTAALALAACQPRPVTITQEVEVTREVTVEATVLVPQQGANGKQATPKPIGTAPVHPDGSHSAASAPTPPAQGALIHPYPDAPLCPDSGEHHHDHNLFHTLWDSVRGCHYDHEHGQDPFTSEVAATFPGFNLRALIGSVGLGHTNLSGPAENTQKHGGFKWNVLLAHPQGCEGHEGSPIGVSASAIQYHNFGDYAVEFDAVVHSALGLLRQCVTSDPADYGYIYVVQHVDYGQRVAPYQGNVLAYPNSPVPAYPSGLGPYVTVDCIGGIPPCDKYATREELVARNANAASTWTSEPRNLVNSGSSLFEILFRVRDNYQVLDWRDQTYPYTFLWLCSNDGGLTYAAIAGCRYNNSTPAIHEVNGTIPAAWDNMDGFDTDSRVGRITGEGFVTRFGALNPSCTAPGPDCHPIKMVQAFVGYYGSFLLPTKEGQFGPQGLPERDIYFCGGQVCAESDSGAVSSGWIGQNN
jgi:hypothetical protein